jgi:hypothetical protein
MRIARELSERTKRTPERAHWKTGKAGLVATDGEGLQLLNKLEIHRIR